jgi:phosphoglycolate phosphatase-like HAD superfamily hydrolase
VRRHKVVLFDIDCTLTTSGSGPRRALERAVAEVAGAPYRAPRVPMHGRTDPAILREVLAHMGLEPARALMDAIFDRYVGYLPGELEACGGGAIMPGVGETIAALEGRPGVHLGILTGNIARGAAIKLAAHGLAHRFRFGAYGDDGEARPDLYPVALARWREACAPSGACRPEDVYVVGDTIHDVGVARAHGARAVAVGTGHPWQDRGALLALAPDFFFEDLRASRPFVEEVLLDA